MKILYIGDIMGKPGRQAVAEILPDLRQAYTVDFVVAQSENVSHGKSMLPGHMHELMELGIDFFTGGNHSFERQQLIPLINDPGMPVVAPANMAANESVGWKLTVKNDQKIAVVSILGTVFPGGHEMKNPLQTIDEILEQDDVRHADIKIVNIHSDYSSEKVMFGHYLDGRVHIVVGDHWHVPTADASILPNGTAHISDVGMCGSLNSSLGIAFEQTIPRWRDEIKTKQVLAEDKPWQFNALFVDTNSKSIEHIRRLIVE